MRHKTVHFSKRNLFAIFLLLSAVISGCTKDVANHNMQADVTQDVSSTASSGEDQTSAITGVNISEDGNDMIVRIMGNSFLTYTSVKQPLPLGVILYFPETRREGPATLSPESGSVMIRSVKFSDAGNDGKTTRLEILLNQDVTYGVEREGNDIKVVFHKTAISSAAPADTVAAPAVDLPSAASETGAVPATRLNRIETEASDGLLKIIVHADGMIQNYKPFTIDDPARIIFDIFNLACSQRKEQIISVNSPFARNVRYYGYPDRLRLVIDTESQYLSSYRSNSVQGGLVIDMAGSPQNASLLNTAELNSGAAFPSEYSEPAVVNRVDFLTEDAGKSVVIVGTTHPVKYELNKTAPGSLQLELFDTKVPDYRQRPLITTSFDSAVDRVMPFQSSTREDVALLKFDLREMVPYWVEQSDNLLKIRFESSSVPPRQAAQTDLSSGETVSGPALAENKVQPAGNHPKSAETDNVKKSALSDTKAYRGEKVALDFYETDIKNVFRILNSISGKNFAIDKDVTGKVTMTLDTPVPWDQVLDLVLRMNRLGMVEEGNIIRIATLSSLKKEEELRRAQLAAEQKSKEQEKALEPLMTEYLRVNYSNAKEDILPHLEHLVTEKRGSLSADECNNQIIMTDTREKLEKARQIIREIDKVTPQVIIEARIVEVGDDFSRDLGIAWNARIGENNPINIDGSELDLSTAINYPVASSSAIGFNFNKLTGTDLVLNATLTAHESKGELEIVSSPKIVTLDNKKATIKQGLEIPYNVSDDGGNAITKFKDADLLLEVTPHVTPDQRIMMSMYITKNDIEGYSDDGVPTLSTNEAETELLVNDGDTIVIGGIVKTTSSWSETKFPFLADIPVMGSLFKSTLKDETKNELLIFITPRIVQLEQRSS